MDITSSRNTAMFIAFGSWHAIVAFPGAVVLVPLPDVTGESRFGVDLVLDAYIPSRRRSAPPVRSCADARRAERTPRCRDARQRRCAARRSSRAIPPGGRCRRCLTASCARRSTSSGLYNSGKNSQPSRLKSSTCCWVSPMDSSSLGDTQKQVSQFSVRHCERSEAIQGPEHPRLGCWHRACCGPWIASSQGLLAMTDGSPLSRSLREVIGRRLIPARKRTVPNIKARFERKDLLGRTS